MMEMTLENEDIDTRERIKDAARQIFMKHGLEGARTEEIANLSQTNPSLISYYFKGKEKLFDTVLSETFSAFIDRVEKIVNTIDTDFETKVHQLVDCYSDLILESPHLPMATLIKIRKKNRAILSYTNRMRVMLHRSEMAKQFQQRINKGAYKQAILAQVIINLVSLTLFPALAAPVLSNMGDMKQDAFMMLIKDRRQYIADWVLYTLR
jgi:TetR/AcrR family transcriptional regulator